MSDLAIAEHYPEMNRLAAEFLGDYLGPGFTATPQGHIQTDIAAACSLSGLMILQEVVPDLPALARRKPGIALIAEVHELQNEVFTFMANVAASNGLDPSSGWNNLGAINDPMYDCVEMTRRLAPAFYAHFASFERRYFKFLGALIGMKLVRAGASVGLLEPDVGKGLAAFYVLSGSKCMPSAEALWPPAAAAAPTI